MDSNQFSNTNEAAYTAPAQPLYTQQSASGEIYAKPEIKCPGKEITGMVFGINALVWGVLAIILAWFPFYGLIFGLSYGIVGIACAIVTFVLYNKVKEQATVITNKILRGRSLAKAGLIVSIISVVVA
ncbi:MAG: hypothetical protein K5669_03705, partial [Lachnospiraceae bacterium]|nr:hypothetical protein [Lachnospiraceae bacterium]